MKKETQKMGKMKKFEVIQLNNVLSGIKIGKVSKDSAFALVDVKVELSGYVKEFEETRKTAAEEFKPEGLKGEGVDDAVDETTKNLQKKWNMKVAEYLNKRMDEEVEVKLATLPKDEVYELAKDNGLTIQDIEILMVLVG